MASRPSAAASLGLAAAVAAAAAAGFLTHVDRFGETPWLELLRRETPLSS